MYVILLLLSVPALFVGLAIALNANSAIQEILAANVLVVWAVLLAGSFIGSEVKLDLTPMWLKLQTLKGVYGYGMVTYEATERHVFDIALEFMLAGQINTEVLVTHKFSLENYMEMIEVNMNKGKHNAIKTLVSFA